MDYKTVQTAMVKRAADASDLKDTTKAVKPEANDIGKMKIETSPTFFGGKPKDDLKLFQKPGGVGTLYNETMNRVSNPPMLASRTPYYDSRVAATSAAADKYDAFKKSFDPADFKKEDGEALEGVAPNKAISAMAPTYFDMYLERIKEEPEADFVDRARKHQADSLVHGFVSPEGTTQYRAARDYLYNAGKVNEQYFKDTGRVPLPVDAAPYGELPKNLTPDQQKRLMILRHSMGATQKPGIYSNLS